MEGLAGLTAAVVACVCLTGCTSEAVRDRGPSALPPSSAQAASPTNTTREPPRFAPSVTDPRDARGIGECDLLTSAQLDELGLVAETARPRVSGAARVCSWAYEGGKNSAGLQIATDRTIPGLDGIYMQRAGFALFEPTTVAGHPGFRADQAEGDGCTLYIAIADYQLLAAAGNGLGEPLPDPCAPSRRMAEMILSNLPPLAD